MHRTPIYYTDQMQRTIVLDAPPKRIISLVPSQTELLYSLGLDQEVVGITKFCVHPQHWFSTKVRVGGTKQYKMDIIKALNPDLIIGNKEENDRAQIENLAQHYPVWMSDIKTLEDALDMINRLGELFGRSDEAQRMAARIQNGFDELAAAMNLSAPKRAAYFIWRKPYMVAAADTFIDTLLQKAGFENIFATQSRYPAVSADELAALQPEYILLSSEPFPFQQKHVEEFQTICPTAKVMVVNGEYFSWYGSRLLGAVAYFRSLQ